MDLGLIFIVLFTIYSVVVILANIVLIIGDEEKQSYSDSLFAFFTVMLWPITATVVLVAYIKNKQNDTTRKDI